MDNFTVFNKDELKQRLDAFVVGMSDAITPIKYEAITPDIFCFLFRTTDAERKDNFFVLISFDHITNSQHAKSIIEEWSNSKTKKFLNPIGPRHTVMDNDDELSEYAKGYDDSNYYSMLALVERPNGKDYWSTYLTIYPGEDLADRIEEWTKDEQEKIIRAYLTMATQLNSYESSNFPNVLDGNHSPLNPQAPIIQNKSKYAITFYKNSSGEWELFWDTVNALN